MHVTLTELRDRIRLRGDVPPPTRTNGKPGWYEIELDRFQAMALAGRLYSLAQEMEPPGKVYAPKGG